MNYEKSIGDKLLEKWGNDIRIDNSVKAFKKGNIYSEAPYPSVSLKDEITKNLREEISKHYSFEGFTRFMNYIALELEKDIDESVDLESIKDKILEKNIPDEIEQGEYNISNIDVECEKVIGNIKYKMILIELIPEVDEEEWKDADPIELLEAIGLSTELVYLLAKIRL